MKFSKLTEYELSIIKNKELSVEDIQKIIGCSGATLYRWRKKLNASPGRGSKKGKSRPWQLKDLEDRCCLYCNNIFSVKPGSTKKYCSRTCVSKNIDRSYMQTEEYKNTIRNHDLPDFMKYTRLVQYHTRKIYEQYSNIINPNGFKRGLAGVEGAYHLDHIIPIKYGYENNIPPEEIAKIENLQMLPWRSNIIKSSKHKEIG